CFGSPDALNGRHTCPIRGEGGGKVMSEQNATGVQSSSGPGWHLPAIIVLGIVAAAGLGFGWNASAKLDSTRQAVAEQVKTMQQSVAQDLATVQDHVTQAEKSNTELQADLSVVTKK